MIKSVQANLAEGRNNVWLTELPNLSPGSCRLVITGGDLQEKKVLINVN